ncbi:MAG: hypothetical protein K2M86_02570, partial [Odoribacter sp.]|nr:hypothetical protein [Odoribacter sp.]
KYIVFGWLWIMVWIGGCSPYSKRLEAVLKYSGDNRPELEKVLEHYAHDAADSLKLAAAVFLIENMPGHYTLSSPMLDRYYEKLDSIREIPYHVKKLFQTFPINRREYTENAQLREDVKYIRSDFLVHNIDLAFQQWKAYPWLKGVDFQTFKEYLLPYRIANEPLDYWRDSISYFQTQLEQKAYYLEDCRYSISVLKNQFYENIPGYLPKIPDESLRKTDIDCIQTAKVQSFVHRIIGIPSSIDFVPHYANRNGSHYWTLEMNPDTRVAQLTQAILYRVAKVYRQTYSHQPVFQVRSNEYIPLFFRDPFHYDVTSEYLRITDVAVRLPQRIRNKYAYLATFNDLVWQPITGAEIKGKEVRFEALGRDIVYLPVYYDGNESMLPLAPPFVVYSDGTIEHLRTRKDSTLSMKMFRKYPESRIHEYWYRSLADARIEASDNPDFKEADTVYVNTKRLNSDYEYIRLDTPLLKRYWRITSANRLSLQLADLHFYDNHLQEMKGRVMNVDSVNAAALWDDDPLTNATVSWVGMDFGKARQVSQVRLLPRNDANGIYPGNQYELFYYDFPRGWISLGIKHPTGNELEYEKVPAGTLYWLRNLTTGKEERIFTWEDGQARFW